MKEVSIIIPHYNTPKLLRKLIETIQPIEMFQVIVIDDYSDKDLEIYKQCKAIYEKKEVIFLQNNRKKGAGACRNIGIEYAVCEWVLFADADDYFLEGLYDKLQPYLNSCADIIYFKTYSEELISHARGTRHILYCKLVDNYMRRNNVKNEVRLRYKFGPPWGKLIRRNLIKEYSLRFDEIPVSNDIMFSVKCGFYAKHITVSDAYLYMIVKMQGTLTQIKKDDLIKVRIDTSLNKYTFLKNNLCHNEWKYLHLCRLMFVYNSYKNCYSKEVKKYLRKRMKEEKIPLIQ